MAWYKAGTISVSGKTVTGAGTNWTDNKMGIGPGQALLIPSAGSVKMYEIARVDSATKITLASDAGTMSAGSAYAIMSFYTDSVPNFARRLSAQLSYYQSQMDGWQQIMTGTGTINIEAPDGTIVAISSFKKLTDDMAGKAGKADLGTAAAFDIQSSTTDATPDRVMRLGGFGLGRTLPTALQLSSLGTTTPTGFYWSSLDGSISSVPPASGTYVTLLMQRGERPCALAMNYLVGKSFFGYRTANGWSWVEAYTTGNTTKASDGTLKAASPVCRIVKSQEETARADVDEEGFSWCGAGTANGEAAGIAITRQDVGVYEITGAAGLAGDGWRLLPPRDPNGSGDLGIVEATVTDSVITVRLYKRRWQLTDDGDIEPARGAPMDVPANSWIDVRLSMPVSADIV
jgi:hypothetical protein